MKKEATNSLRARDIGALTTLGTFVYTDRKKEIYCMHPVTCYDVEKKCDVSTAAVSGTICENGLGQAALRREQQERLESNHCEKLDETNHSPWDRRNGSIPVVH
jgi:hypothetical protein